MRFGKVFYIIVLLICVLEFVRLWNIAPPQMAAHFNAQGIPDRFVPKPEFFWFQIKTILVAIGVSILPQIMFLILPVNFINMPHREYWLAPERRAETVDRLSSFGSMLFGVILLVIQIGFELAVDANLHTPIRFNAQWMSMALIAFLIVASLLLFWLVISFRPPVSNDDGRVE